MLQGNADLKRFWAKRPLGSADGRAYPMNVLIAPLYVAAG
jgi:hypothetical protein